MFRQLVLEPVTDTALPAMTVLRSFAEKDNVKLLTATEYNCTVHMFRQLGLEPVTDAVLPTMIKLEAFQNKTVPILLYFRYYFVLCLVFLCFYRHNIPFIPE